MSFLFVGVCFGDNSVPVLKNYKPGSEKNHPIPIVDLFWSTEDDNDRRDLVVAFGSGVVKWYNTKLKAFEQEVDLEIGETPVVSMRQYKE